MSVRIEPATKDRWNDAPAAFGRQASNPASCWCQRFMVHNAPTNREALRGEVDAARVPIGLLAYDDDQAVGWTRVVPRRTLPGVLNNRALRRILVEDENAWWVTCFVVRREHRETGVARALLAAAVAYARRHGASALEGHPVDVGRLRASKVSGSALFTGTLSMFKAAGFEEIGRTYGSRPVMRLAFAAPVR